MKTHALPHEGAGPRTLGYIRVAVASIWIIKLLPDSFTWMSAFPVEAFRSYGVLRLIPAGLLELTGNVSTLLAFKGVLLTLLALLLVGVKPYPLIAIATAVGLTIHQGLARGFAYDNHQELPALFCVYVLAFFPAADGFSWPPRRRLSPRPAIYGAAITSMAIVVLLPYSAIAAYRLSRSAPEIFLGNSMPYFLGFLSGLETDGWRLGLKVLEYRFLYPALGIAFLFTTLLELVAPFSLIHKPFRALWVLGITAFHISTWLLMNIFFWESMLLILILLTDWETGMRKALAKLSPAVAPAEAQT